MTRTVLVGRRWVAKVPSLRAHGHGVRGSLWSLARGIAANLSECEWSGQPGVAPVRWSLLAGLVNVYPYASPPPITPGVPDEQACDYESIRFPYLGSMDLKPANVGVLDGELVWVDYDMNWNDRPPCQHADRDDADQGDLAGEVGVG